jgi:zinc-binding alcohol dehydrogenase/oxidoreductase
MGSPSDFFDMVAFMEQHEIRPMVDRTFAFNDALKAFETLESGQQIGKIVLQH